MARKSNRLTKRSTTIQSTVPVTRPEKYVIDMECKNGCGRLVHDVSGLKAVTCAYCVAQMIDPPTQKAKPEEVRPRGWQFMNRYVSPSGKVYSKGKEVHEPTPTRKGKAQANPRTKAAKTKSASTNTRRRTAPAKRGRKRRK